MERRDFVKKLSFAPLFGVPSYLKGSPDKVEAESKQQNNKNAYKGFILCWSGWLTNPEADRINGYWTAKKGEIRFFATTGGISGSYVIGEVFNLCTLEGHNILTSFSTEEEKEIEKQRALDEIKRLIREFRRN